MLAHRRGTQPATTPQPKHETHPPIPPTSKEVVLNTDTRLAVVPSSTLGWQEQPATHSSRAVPMPL